VRAARAAGGADTGASAARATDRPGAATATAAIATGRVAAILAGTGRRIGTAPSRAAAAARAAIGEGRRRQGRQQAKDS
jgi:hypothetical protein